VGALAYVISYALFIDPGRRSSRVLSALPYLAMTVAWRIAWQHAGYGARGSGAYIDPLRNPATFLAVAPARWAMLLQGQFSVLPADLSFLAPPAHQLFLLVLAASTVAIVISLLAPFARDALGRFWGAGLLLSLLPLAATFSSDRLLLFVGLGAMALLARLFHAFVDDGARGELRPGARSILSGAFLLLHVGAAPFLLPVRSAQMAAFAAAHDRGARSISTDATVTDKSVVLLAAPTVLFGNYIQAEREALGVPRPRHLYVLAGASSRVEVTRTASNEVDLEPSHGFVYAPLERHYRESFDGMSEGTEVVLSTLRAKIMSRLDDGRPAVVRFSFTDPLDQYIFYRWSGDRYVPCALPQPGERLVLPEQDVNEVVLRTVLSAVGGAIHPPP
jgi:hypothetical protein